MSRASLRAIEPVPTTVICGERAADIVKCDDMAMDDGDLSTSESRTMTAASHCAAHKLNST